jgi:uncharacterized DUF497 family protein
MATWEFVDWLMFWILETSHFEFEWDEGNQTKSQKKHKVTIPEVEHVFRSGLAVPLGIQLTPKKEEQRLGLIGPTINGRLLQVAFVLRDGRVRPVSARPAKRKERKQYEETLRQVSERIR